MVLTKAFWLSLALAGIIYAVMMLWTLPSITGSAGGQLPFDLRPGGYSLAEAREFAAALSPDGRKLYLGAQQSLDTAYPFLLAVTLGLGIRLLSPVSAGAWRWLIASLALPGAVFDYWENALVARILQAEPATLSADLVTPASHATMAKSAFTAVAMIVLVGLFVRWLWRKTAARRQT